MARPTILYGTRRSAEALAKAVRRYRLPVGANVRFEVEPRACGQGFEVVRYPRDAPAVKRRGIGEVVTPTTYEHNLALWNMQAEAAKCRAQ